MGVETMLPQQICLAQILNGPAHHASPLFHEWVICRDLRLALYDIQAGTEDLAVLECLDESIRVYDGSAEQHGTGQPAAMVGAGSAENEHTLEQC